MGSTGIYKSMKDTKEMLIKEFSFTNEKLTSTVLAHANGAGGMWILQDLKFKDGRSNYITAVWINMFHRNGETIYKEIDIK